MISIFFSYSFSIYFNKISPLSFPFAFIIVAIDTPPAPTPSFTKPFANAFSPSFVDSIKCKSATKMPTFLSIDKSRFVKSALASLKIYFVVPIKTLSVLTLIFFKMNKKEFDHYQ